VDSAAAADGARTRGFCCVDVDPTGLRLLGLSTGGKLHIYDLLRPQLGPTQTLQGHSSDTFYVKAAFSPDGRFVASGSSDKLGYVWDTRQPHATPARLVGHQGEVTCVDFCRARAGPHARALASCSDDATVRVWGGETAVEGRTFITPPRGPHGARALGGARPPPADATAAAAPAALASAARTARAPPQPLARVRTIQDFWGADATAAASPQSHRNDIWEVPARTLGRRE
jgi:hypothetical protein